MEPLDTEEGFELVPRQTARTYVYTEESEAGPGTLVITDPIAVRPTESGQDVIHQESDDTLSIIRVPWGFLDMHIAEKREFSKKESSKEEFSKEEEPWTDLHGSAQDARDVMKNGSETEPANYMPCMNDPQGEVSVGNECIYYPECGCQRPEEPNAGLNPGTISPSHQLDVEDPNTGLEVDGDAEDTIRFEGDFQFGDGGEGPPPNLDV